MEWIVLLYVLFGVEGLVALCWVLHRALIVHRRLTRELVAVRDESASGKRALSERAGEVTESYEKLEQRTVRETHLLHSVLSLSFLPQSPFFRNLTFLVHRSITVAALRARALFEESAALKQKAAADLSDIDTLRLETLDAEIREQREGFYARHKAAADAGIAVLWEVTPFTPEGQTRATPIIVMATRTFMDEERHARRWKEVRARITAYYPGVTVDLTFLPDSIDIAEGHVAATAAEQVVEAKLATTS